MKNLDIKKLLIEFKDNLKINHDLKKKKIGLISVEKQNYFLKLKI